LRCDNICQGEGNSLQLEATGDFDLIASTRVDHKIIDLVATILLRGNKGAGCVATFIHIYQVAGQNGRLSTRQLQGYGFLYHTRTPVPADYLPGAHTPDQEIRLLQIQFQADQRCRGIIQNPGNFPRTGGIHLHLCFTSHEHESGKQES